MSLPWNDWKLLCKYNKLYSNSISMESASTPWHPCNWVKFIWKFETFFIPPFTALICHLILAIHQTRQINIFFFYWAVRHTFFLKYLKNKAVVSQCVAYLLYTLWKHWMWKTNKRELHSVVQNIFGLKIFKPVWFLFSFVSDYGNVYYTKQNLKNKKYIYQTTSVTFQRRKNGVQTPPCFHIT